MKHKIDDDVDINVHIPIQDLETLIDKVKDAAVTIILVSAAAHIVKSAFRKDI